MLACFAFIAFGVFAYICTLLFFATLLRISALLRSKQRRPAELHACFVLPPSACLLRFAGGDASVAKKQKLLSLLRKGVAYLGYA
jgi:hypothetical protein